MGLKLGWREAGLILAAAGLSGGMGWAQAAGQGAASAPGTQGAAARPAGGTPAASGLQLHGIEGSGGTDPFPTADPKNFTATTPSAAEVNQFLTQLWGYEPARIWRVMGITKTEAPGVSLVTVLMAERGPNAKPQPASFFVMPDDKHAIAGASMMDFGPKPFEVVREKLQAQADGPSRGAASKALELVEFADLECPHCKEAQTNMTQLEKDFPNAHIVFENFPLVQIHPFAGRAALDGVCVAQAKPDAFWTYQQAVYDTQGGLTAEDGEQTLAAAITKAGLDPKTVEACAATPEAQAKVVASVKLGQSIGVNETPTLVVNGRLVPVSPAAVPYETLKRLVQFQAGADGVK